MLSSSVRCALKGAHGHLRVLTIVQQRSCSVPSKPAQTSLDEYIPYDRPPDHRIEIDSLFKHLDMDEVRKEMRRLKRESPDEVPAFMDKVYYPPPPEDPRDIDHFEPVTRIKWANEVLYGKDRDFKNFPHPKHWSQRELPPLRHKIFPERWFPQMYEKLGVTGPYILFFGGLFAGLSHGFIYLTSYGGKTIMFSFVMWRVMYKGQLWKKLFPKGVNHALKMLDRDVTEPMKRNRATNDRIIKESEAAKGYIKSRLKIWPAHIENFQLMLEDEYRNRLQNVYTQVKNRLDYQVTMETSMKNFEQEHMVNWITDSVTKSITPEIEKKNIAACIDQLKLLSKSATI